MDTWSMTHTKVDTNQWLDNITFNAGKTYQTNIIMSWIFTVNVLTNMRGLCAGEYHRDSYLRTYMFPTNIEYWILNIDGYIYSWSFDNNYDSMREIYCWKDNHVVSLFNFIFSAICDIYTYLWGICISIENRALSGWWLYRHYHNPIS